MDMAADAVAAASSSDVHAHARSWVLCPAPKRGVVPGGPAEPEVTKDTTAAERMVGGGKPALARAKVSADVFCRLDAAALAKALVVEVIVMLTMTPGASRRRREVATTVTFTWLVWTPAKPAIFCTKVVCMAVKAVKFMGSDRDIFTTYVVVTTEAGVVVCDGACDGACS